MKISRKVKEVRFSADILIICIFWEIFTNFWNRKQWDACRQNLFCEFCGLDPLGTLALVDTGTLSCFNHNYLRIFTRAPCLDLSIFRAGLKKFCYFGLKNSCPWPSHYTHRASIFRPGSGRDWAWAGRPRIL
jgi:hypothetical protein